MARARNIKPSFFTNDLLAECDPLCRILFIGLWTIADREGRLEDRPKRIKAEVLPYDKGDINSQIQQLAEAGFIIRYDVDGIRYIQIRNFCKHQNPHKNEAASSIPEPTGESSTRAAPEQNQSDPAESISLLLKPSPDSGIHKAACKKPAVDRLPDWVPRDEWLAFVEMRRGKRNVPTGKAIELLIKQLDDLRRKGADPKTIIEQSIVKGWLDFYPIKTTQQGAGNAKPTSRHTGFGEIDYHGPAENSGFDTN